MKINVSLIIKDHHRTLYDNRTGRTSLYDIFSFYILPILVAIFIILFRFNPKLDSYNLSVTFFGIFIALLLNIQVAIFAIFQRRWELFSDSRQAAAQKAKLEIRRTLLRELSTNISYLIVVGSFSLVFFLVIFVIAYHTKWTAAIGAALYAHFMLVFMMIVKRSHALFQMEYSDNARELSSPARPSTSSSQPDGNQ